VEVSMIATSARTEQKDQRYDKKYHSEHREGKRFTKHLALQHSFSSPLSRVNVPLTQLSGASYAYLHVFLSKFMSSFLYPQTL